MRGKHTHHAPRERTPRLKEQGEDAGKRGVSSDTDQKQWEAEEAMVVEDDGGNQVDHSRLERGQDLRAGEGALGPVSGSAGGGGGGGGAGGGGGEGGGGVDEERAAANTVSSAGLVQLRGLAATLAAAQDGERRRRRRRRRLREEVVEVVVEEGEASWVRV